MDFLLDIADALLLIFQFKNNDKESCFINIFLKYKNLIYKFYNKTVSCIIKYLIYINFGAYWTIKF